MSVISGIGDFFRGAFGESEDEKRRRKQREAQQSQQRQQQAQAQQKQQSQQVKTVGDMFGAKPAQPKVATPVAPQQLQQSKPAPKKTPLPPPVAQPAPLGTDGKVDFTKLKAAPKGNPIKPGSAQDKVNKTIDTAATSTARVATGLGQGLSGFVDLVTPGKGNSRVTKSLNQSAEEMDKYAKDAGIEKAYKTLNVPLEIGTYFIPTTIATKIAAKIPKATKLTTTIVDKAAGLIDNAGDAGKVRQALAEGARKGMTLEQALADNAINLKYTGEQTAHGEKVTPESIAGNAALGVAGGTAPTVIKRLFKGKTNQDNTIKTAQTAVDTAQTAVDTAQTAAKAKTAPAPEDIVQATPTPANAEQAANNAYEPPQRTYAEHSNAVLDAVGIKNKDVKRGNFAYNNPLTKIYNKLQQGYIEKVDAVGNKITDKLQEGVQSGNTFTRGATELPRLFFKNFAQKKEAVSAMIKRTSYLQNSGKIAVAALKQMEDAVKKAGDPAQVYERIYRVLETPEYLARRYGDATKLTPNDLSPAERVAFDRLVEINKIRNKINYETGLINADQYAQYADGMHSPRIYDINVQYPQMQNAKGLDLNAAKKRKDLQDVPDYIFDESIASPFQASALRLESALKNKANHEALQNLDAINGLPTSAPNKNFVQLVGKKYGEFDGRYIDKQLLSQIDNKDYYNSNIGQQTGDLINTFHNSILGAPGRAYKKFRTTLSPGTIVGNIGSGQFAFSKAVNINPLTSMVRTAQATKQLASNGINPQVQEAELAGLFAGDTGRMINNTKQAEHAVGNKDNLWDKAGNFYGGIDRATALGWYNELRARGLSPEKAVARVHLGMQNYGNAGRVVGALADAPVLGKPFARFTPELLRIAKNALAYNPVGTVGTAVGGVYGLNKLSDMFGETPEERKTREEAHGQTKIGGVSLNIPIPKNVPVIGDSSVNIARAIGLNFPQEPNGDPNSAIVKQLNPVADFTRTNAQGEQVIAPNQLVSDMFYRQIADQVANRDFMGREITDPNNKTYYEDGKASIKKFPDDLSDSEKLKNRLRAAGMGLPFAPEADNLYNSVKGQEDFYGKERTLPQAIGRMFGVKVENNDQAARDKRTSSNRFFDEDLPAVQKFVTENPDLAQKYYQIKNPTRTRPTGKDDNGTKTSELITPEKWDIINSDTSGRLFDFMKSQDERLNARSIAEKAIDPSKQIKPIDPIFELPADQAKYVAELRSRPSGDDIEAQDILRATSDWYKNYEDKYHAYLTNNSKYFDSQPAFDGAAKDNPRVKEYGDSSVPIEQPDIIKEYYKIKAADPEKAKEVYKANKDVLSKAFDSYAKDRLDRINKLRKIEGFDPISIETYKNKTFGFDANDSSGSYGGYGSGSKSGRIPDVNTLGNITNFTKGVNLLDPMDAQAMPQIAQFFNTLNAGGGGSKAKPKVGASSSGR